jgi:sensor histidine kinase YesM
MSIGLWYSAAMARQRSLTFSSALGQGFSYAFPAAVLGIAVLAITRRVAWPPARPWTFVLIHLTAAATLGIAWLGFEIAAIAVGTGLPLALQISRQFEGFQILDGIFVYAVIASISYIVRISTRLREQEARAARAEALRTQAELAALRGQLNPHFLFNTLHTLTALVRRDPDTAEHALQRFGDMLRYVLDMKRSSREDVTLGDELRFLRDYLSLERLRFGDRLRVIESVDPDCLDCVVPTLTLQPLVENAIKHGVAPRASGGTIEIAARLEGETLVLEVCDDGPGAPGDAVKTASGMGLRAVRQRLATRFESAARFEVVTAPGEGFVVRASLPAQTGAERLAGKS